jgi:hypothetical protein
MAAAAPPVASASTAAATDAGRSRTTIACEPLNGRQLWFALQKLPTLVQQHEHVSGGLLRNQERSASIGHNNTKGNKNKACEQRRKP